MNYNYLLITQGFSKWIFNLYCIVVILVVMVGYLTLELWDAMNSWHNLDDATQNFCLTFTHLAGLIKVYYKI